jgi:hypothetical protein
MKDARADAPKLRTRLDAMVVAFAPLAAADREGSEGFHAD